MKIKVKIFTNLVSDFSDSNIRVKTGPIILYIKQPNVLSKFINYDTWHAKEQYLEQYRKHIKNLIGNMKRNIQELNSL